MNFTPLKNVNSLRYALFSTRMAAYVIDILIFSPAVILVLFLPISQSIKDYINSILSLLYILYLIITTKKYGQTLGKKIFHIRVVKQNGGQLTWTTVFIREFIGRIISQFFYLGYLAVLRNRNKNRKGWHDSLAGTIVIQEKELDGKRKVFQIMLDVLFIFVIFLLPIIITISFMFRFKDDSEKTDLLANFNQKVQILEITSPGNTEMSRFSQSELSNYKIRLREECIKIRKLPDCSISQLKLKTIEDLNKSLEKSLTDLVNIQSQTQNK